MRKGISLLALCGMIIFFGSCDKTRVYDNYKSLPNQWHKDSVVVFNVQAPDTLNTYNLFFNVRNNSDYNYSNLYLISEMHFPNGMVLSDTLEYRMAAPSGEWLGTGFGEVKENKLWYKNNVRFTEEGEYEIRLQQAMRKNDEIEGIENLQGITEVGFRIENTQ